MRVVGFTILRNGLLMDYPFREAILSALPLCERFIVSVGQSEDETYQVVQELARRHPTIEVRQSVWDLSNRQGGRVLAVETNKVLENLLPADWVLYLQADEVIMKTIMRLFARLCRKILRMSGWRGWCLIMYTFMGVMRGWGRLGDGIGGRFG
jgi:hypothetical protein